VAALRRARGFLRSEVARRVELRHAPELHFELDRSFDEGARLEALLRSGSVKRDLG
ncbi:MAG: ribosome-binding factor A, partial [Alphaproteobacteria bacterium]|nr:ribosome-binding factor A [Alphaproteobacteria bacterium]